MQNSKKKVRSMGLDIIKAFAIVAVVFFHMGYLKYGYLGVDVFFVINGYLVYRSILKADKEENFSYINFIFDKVIRLWPIILISSLVTFFIGYVLMLPDAFENLNESIVATNIFANNILQCITTKNYWEVANNYKPLMHTWYLGVIMQSYFILPLPVMIARKIKKETCSFSTILISILSVLSLALYLFSRYSDAYKFYFVPFRFFEIGIGAFIACISVSKTPLRVIKKQAITFISLIITCMLVFLNLDLFSSSIRLLLVCLGTVLAIPGIVNNTNIEKKIAILPLLPSLLSGVGKATLSIYIWHQIILAFYRYAVTSHFEFIDFMLYFVLIITISILSYVLIEQKANNIILKHKKKSSIILLVLCFIELGMSFYYYQRAGVVRDVPELNISTSNISKRMHSSYTDRINDYDHDFSNNGYLKVLVVGDSFARDWGNVILEYMNGDVDLSYIHPYTEQYVQERSIRINDADIIYYAVHPDFDHLPMYLQKQYDEGHVYVIGTKSFGESNGIPYNQRNKPDYYSYTVNIDSELIERNERQKEEYGDHYVDMLSPVLVNESSVMIFTPDHKYISQDCRHLTQMGARFYADSLSSVIENHIEEINVE